MLSINEIEKFLQELGSKKLTPGGGSSLGLLINQYLDCFFEFNDNNEYYKLAKQIIKTDSEYFERMWKAFKEGKEDKEAIDQSNRDLLKLRDLTIKFSDHIVSETTFFDIEKVSDSQSGYLKLLAQIIDDFIKNIDSNEVQQYGYSSLIDTEIKLPKEIYFDASIFCMVMEYFAFVYKLAISLLKKCLLISAYEEDSLQVKELDALYIACSKFEEFIQESYYEDEELEEEEQNEFDQQLVSLENVQAKLFEITFEIEKKIKKSIFSDYILAKDLVILIGIPTVFVD